MRRLIRACRPTCADSTAHVARYTLRSAQCLVLILSSFCIQVCCSHKSTSRPMCASLPYNHAVWTWDTLPGGNSRHLLRDATCQQRVARLAGVTTDSVAQESRRRIGIHTADNILYKVAMGRDYDCEAGWIETISISTGRNSTRPMFRPGAGAAHYFENDTEDESDTE